MRRLLLVLLVLLVLGGVAGLVLHFYLHSERVTQQVAAHLESVYGGQVKVGGVEVGLNSSTVQDLQLYDQPAAGTPAHSWLNVKSLSADVSLWQMAHGAALPSHLTLHGPTVVLRFDHDGQLLTRLPESEGTAQTGFGSIPDLELVDGEIVFQKQGYPDLIAKHVTARLTRQGEAMVLTGSAENDVLGKLLAEGQLHTDSSQLHAVLKTEKAAKVDQKFLLRVPFVPVRLWEEVQIARAESPAELSVDYDLKQRQLRYRLDLTPRHAEGSIPALELAAHDAHGTVVVEDDLIKLRHVTAQAFDGTITLDGDLDFRGSVDRLDFSKIVVKGLNVSKLPPSWKFPPQIKGLLDGTASAHVTYGPGPFDPKAVGSLLGVVAAAPAASVGCTSATVFAILPKNVLNTDGQGVGKMRNATILGEPAEELDINWTPAGFQTKDDEASARERGQELLLVAAVSNTLFMQAEAASPLSYPLGVVSTVVDGVQTISRGIADTVDTLAHRVPRAVQPAAPGEKTSYVTINLKLKDVDLAQFVTKLKVNFPFKVGGKLALQVKASLPLNRASDIKEYKATGTAELQDLRLDNLHLSSATAEIAYEKGVLDLRNLQGRFAAEPGTGVGSFKGKAHLEVAPLGEMTANLDLDQVPLDQVPLATEKKLQLGGAVSGQFALRIPAGKFEEGAAWDARGSLTSKDVTALGLHLTDVAVKLRLFFGVLSLSEFKGNLDGAPISATGQVALTGDYLYSAALQLQDWDVGSLNRLAPQFHLPVAVRGQFSTQAKVNGKLKPFTLNVAGKANAHDLQIEKFTLQDLAFNWQATSQQITVSNLDVHLYGGEVTGKVVVPLAATEAGNVALKIDRLDLKDMVAALNVPIPVEGKVHGVVTADIPPAAPGKERTAVGKAELTAPEMKLKGIPTDKVRAELKYVNGAIDYKAVGKLLGGDFEVDGEIPIITPPASKTSTKEGHLQLKGLNLALLARALRLPALAPLGGQMSVQATFTQALADRLPEGKGEFSLNRLNWQGKPVADVRTGSFTLRKGVLTLPMLSGNIAEGTFEARLVANLLRPEQGEFTLRLDNVRVDELLATLGEPFQGVQGQLTARIRGRLGSEWQGTADAVFMHGKIHGLAVDEWRLPIHWRFAPGQSRGQVNIYETHAQVAGGRASGRMNLTWDFTAQVDGLIEFYGLNVQNLLRETTGSSQLGSGQMAGRFDFVGRDVRSIDDLSGALKASFGQTQALQVPGFRDLTPFLGIGPTTTFQKGSLTARLERGVLRILAMTLEGSTADIFVNGTVNRKGPLNLELIAKTDFVGLPTLPLKVLGLRLPVAGPVPLTLLVQASNLLSNRVLYLRITGTLRNPVVRLETLRTLEQEAVRFFIYRAAGVPGSNF